MKKTYQVPKVSVCLYLENDVLTSSPSANDLVEKDIDWVKNPFNI